MKKLFTLVATMLATASLMAAVYNCAPNTDAMEWWLTQISEGDTLLMADGDYYENYSIAYNLNKAVIMAAEGAHPVFHLGSYQKIHSTTTFKGIKFVSGQPSEGTGKWEYTFYIKDDSHKNLILEDCEITGTSSYSITTSSSAHIDSIIINNSFFHDNANSAVYMVAQKSLDNNRPTCDYLKITNTTIANVKSIAGCAVIDVRNNSSSDASKTSGTPGESTELFIDHITLWNYNHTGDNNGGIMSYKSPRVTIQNSIIANPDSITGMYATYCYGGNAANCLIYNTSHRSGITVADGVTGDPLFVDAAALNFQLQTNSPAIGAGTGGSNIGDPRWGVAGPGTALMKVAAEKNINKMMINGKMVIVRDGQAYNVLGTAL